MMKNRMLCMGIDFAHKDKDVTVRKLPNGYWEIIE